MQRESKLQLCYPEKSNLSKILFSCCKHLTTNATILNFSKQVGLTDYTAYFMVKLEPNQFERRHELDKNVKANNQIISCMSTSPLFQWNFWTSCHACAARLPSNIQNRCVRSRIFGAVFFKLQHKIRKQKQKLKQPKNTVFSKAFLE